MCKINENCKENMLQVHLSFHITCINQFRFGIENGYRIEPQLYKSNNNTTYLG